VAEDSGSQEWKATHGGSLVGYAGGGGDSDSSKTSTGASTDVASRLGALGVKASFGSDAPKREDYKGADGMTQYSKDLRAFLRKKAQNTSLSNDAAGGTSPSTPTK
jgi:hypothetical protein